MYRQLANVAHGVKGQLEACLSALDRHEDLPEEAEALTSNLMQGIQLCDEILQAGETEPEEGSPSEESAGGSGQGSKKAAASKTKE